MHAEYVAGMQPQQGWSRQAVLPLRRVVAALSCGGDPHACCRLSEKIRAARVNKERALQLQEKAHLAAQEAEYDKVYDTVGENASTVGSADNVCNQHFRQSGSLNP